MGLEIWINYLNFRLFLTVSGSPRASCPPVLPFSGPGPYGIWNQFHQLDWVIPKIIHTPPTEEIFTIQREEGNCLKNFLNLYRVSREEGVLLISSVVVGGMTK